MWLPVERHWRLNERHYGALQGLNKAETAAEHGEEQVHIWRRSYDIPPPALDVDDEIGGYRIPKGSIVALSPWVTHRRPDLWPDPERFDPERHTPERVAARPRYAYFPFSGGSRICLGKAFAMMEARLVLGTLAQRVEFEVPDNYQPELKAELSMHPDGGMPATVRKR